MLDSYVEYLKPYQCHVCHIGKSDENTSNATSTCTRLQRCSLCKIMCYCSKECQRKHWKQHKKGECEQLKSQREFWIKEVENVCEDGTDLFIIGTRVATELGDHPLAVETYEKAINTNIPDQGGHLVAMCYAAYHYEYGHGIPQDIERAFTLYQKILNHPHFGEENFHPACLGLSRIYEKGIVKTIDVPGSASSVVTVVEKNLELSVKYKKFSESNAERSYQIEDLEKWWSQNKSKFLDNSMAH